MTPPSDDRTKKQPPTRRSTASGGTAPSGSTGPGRFYVPAPGSPPAGQSARSSHTVAPPAQRPAGSAGPSKTGAKAPADRGGRGGGVPTVPGARALRRAGRPKFRWLLYVPLLLVLLIVAALVWGFSQFRAIERVDLGDALDAPGGGPMNYLLVGSDSREGLDPENPGGAATVSGRRSDTIIVLRVEGDQALMMSVPRDLWVTQADSGAQERVNAAYNKGPANLVRTVKGALSIPIHHYIEVDFLSFSGVVDAIGGVTVNFPYPASDAQSGLNIQQSGDVDLDGTQALAYVRSRHYTETVDGRQRTDPTGDLGRQQRQQEFLTAALSEVGNTRNPIELAGVATSLTKGLTVDTELGFLQALNLARGLGGSETETVILPTKPARISGKAVLILQEAEAQEALSRFR